MFWVVVGCMFKPPRTYTTGMSYIKLVLLFLSMFISTVHHSLRNRVSRKAMCNRLGA